MPKPLKTRRVSTPDRKGVFGQEAKALRVGLYARVSTHDQKTLPLQLLAMRDYAKKRSWAVAVEIKDVGSGAVAAGPGQHAPGTERTRRGIRVTLRSARPDDPQRQSARRRSRRRAGPGKDKSECQTASQARGPFWREPCVGTGEDQRHMAQPKIRSPVGGGKPDGGMATGTGHLEQNRYGRASGK